MAMKKIYFAIIGLFLFLQSCKTDININGEFTPVPVVFGLLDQNDSIHMIKINRSYTGDGNTLVSASIADSNYWNQVEAYVYEIEPGTIITNQNDWDTIRVWQLQDTIIQTKDTNGVFFSPEQKVYYFSTPNTVAGKLKDGHLYHFQAILNEGEHVVKGETQLVTTTGSNNVNITSPGGNQAWVFINATEYKTMNVTWTVGDALLFGPKIYFLYDEHIGATVTRREIELNLGEVDAEGLVGSTLSRIVQGETFYQNIANKVTEDPSVDKRVFKGIRLDITAGSEDLFKYIQISQPSSSLSQTQPTYTNLTGGLGLFASRTTVSQLKDAYNQASPNIRALNNLSLKELCTGPFTGTLGFCSDHPADAGEIWYCP